MSLHLPTEQTAPSFLAPAEVELARAFARDGYIIAPSQDRPALDRIAQAVANLAAEHLGLGAPDDPGAFLNAIAQHVDAARLNDLRLHVIAGLAATAWFRPAYFACGRAVLESLVGNELAMQRGLGLSIQLPNDDSSLLPLHSDAWSEDSPFEVVLWIPLVDCYRTKSMFLMPPEVDAQWRDRMASFAVGGVESFFREVEPQLHWLEIPYGSVIVFTHTLMHGNRVNVESDARWSINIRFKGLFTPYSDKQLGDFFDPITLRPATRIGMNYRLPSGFDGRT